MTKPSFTSGEDVFQLMKAYHQHIHTKYNFPILGGNKPMHSLAEVLGMQSKEQLYHYLDKGLQAPAGGHTSLNIRILDTYYDDEFRQAAEVASGDKELQLQFINKYPDSITAMNWSASLEFSDETSNAYDNYRSGVSIGLTRAGNHLDWFGIYEIKDKLGPEASNFLACYTKVADNRSRYVPATGVDDVFIMLINLAIASNKPIKPFNAFKPVVEKLTFRDWSPVSSDDYMYRILAEIRHYLTLQENGAFYSIAFEEALKAGKCLYGNSAQAVANDAFRCIEALSKPESGITASEFMAESLISKAREIVDQVKKYGLTLDTNRVLVDMWMQNISLQ